MNTISTVPTTLVCSTLLRYTAKCEECSTEIAYYAFAPNGYYGPTLHCGKCNKILLIPSMTPFLAWSTLPSSYLVNITGAASPSVTVVEPITITFDHNNAEVKK